MPMLLEISLLGNSILRIVAFRVKAWGAKDPTIQTLINDMIATCKNVKGAGIAAPQVGISLRICVVASKPSARYPNAPLMEPTAMINPVIVSHSALDNEDWEGCLSVPGVRGKVSRYNKVTVSYIDRDGKKRKQVFEGFLARVVQHEIDHLNGIVFTDKIIPKSLISEEEYKKNIRSLTTK